MTTTAPPEADELDLAPPLEHWEQQADENAAWLRVRLDAGDGNSLQFLRHRPPGELREVYRAALRRAGLDPSLDAAEVEPIRGRLVVMSKDARERNQLDEQGEADESIRYVDVAIVMRDAMRLASKGGRYAPAQGGWQAVSLPVPEVAPPEDAPSKADVTKGANKELAAAISRVFDRHTPDTTCGEALRRGKAVCPTCITIDPHSRIPEQSLAPCATLLDLVPR